MKRWIRNDDYNAGYNAGYKAGKIAGVKLSALPPSEPGVIREA